MSIIFAFIVFLKMPLLERLGKLLSWCKALFLLGKKPQFYQKHLQIDLPVDFVLPLILPLILPFLCHKSATTCQIDLNKVPNSKLKLDLWNCIKTEIIETTAPPQKLFFAKENPFEGHHGEAKKM